MKKVWIFLKKINIWTTQGPAISSVHVLISWRKKFSYWFEVHIYVKMYSVFFLEIGPGHNFEHVKYQMSFIFTKPGGCYLADQWIQTLVSDITFSVMSPSWNSSSNSLTLQHERCVVNMGIMHVEIYKILCDVINFLLLYDFRSDRRYRLPWHRSLSHTVNISFFPLKNGSF